MQERELEADVEEVLLCLGSLVPKTVGVGSVTGEYEQLDAKKRCWKVLQALGRNVEERNFLRKCRTSRQN
jgi:hypothetical protein